MLLWVCVAVGRGLRRNLAVFEGIPLVFDFRQGIVLRFLNEILGRTHMGDIRIGESSENGGHHRVGFGLGAAGGVHGIARRGDGGGGLQYFVIVISRIFDVAVWDFF